MSPALGTRFDSSRERHGEDLICRPYSTVETLNPTFKKVSKYEFHSPLRHSYSFVAQCESINWPVVKQTLCHILSVIARQTYGSSGVFKHKEWEGT
jgi:hypothetical protein